MTQKEERAAFVKYSGLVRYCIRRYKYILSREDYEEMEADCLGEIFHAIDDYCPGHESGASVDSFISKYARTKARSFVSSMGNRDAIFNAGMISLSTPAGDGDGTLEDSIADDQIDHTNRLQLSAAIASIQKPRSRDIVQRLVDGQPNRSIGRDYGICRERVRQITVAAVEEMSGNVGRRKPDMETDNRSERP